MKIAVCTLAFNEPQYIAPCIEQWKGLVGIHLVLVSTTTWNGTKHKDDPTAKLAEKHGAKVIEGFWKTEADQRNHGLSLLKDYDYVIINDPDEFYTIEDRCRLIRTLQEDNRRPGYTIRRGNTMLTYWKTHDYVLDPPDQHLPTIVVDPNKAVCTEHRQFALSKDVRDPSVRYSEECGEIKVQMHHFSWVRTDEQVEEKIAAYSHADIIENEWYKKVWLGWKPGLMKVRPYGREQSIAIYRPAPEEIIKLITENQQ